MHNQIGPDPFHAEPDDTLIGRKIAENALGVYAIQSYIERVVAYCKLRCRALAQIGGAGYAFTPACETHRARVPCRLRGWQMTHV